MPFITLTFLGEPRSVDVNTDNIKWFNPADHPRSAEKTGGTAITFLESDTESYVIVRESMEEIRAIIAQAVKA